MRKWKRTLVLYIIAVLVSQSLKAQIIYEPCECDGIKLEDFVSDLEANGYEMIDANIESNESFRSFCPCDEPPALNNSGIESNEIFVDAYDLSFELRESLAAISNISPSFSYEIYTLNDICSSYSTILSAPTNSHSVNLSIVVLDWDCASCDLLFSKVVFDNTCDIIPIDRSEFDTPDLTVGNLSTGDSWWFNSDIGDFQITSGSPGIGYEQISTNSILLELNSYIDETYDGPSVIWNVCGEKLMAYIMITPEFVNGGYEFDVRSDYVIGKTFGVIRGRDYYKDLPNFALNYTSISNISLQFSQHASVALEEEIGLYLMGYGIVNVEQSVSLDFTSNAFRITNACNDIFPSVDMSLWTTHLLDSNLKPLTSEVLYEYQQPSFHANYKVNRFGFNFEPNPSNRFSGCFTFNPCGPVPMCLLQYP